MLKGRERVNIGLLNAFGPKNANNFNNDNEEVKIKRRRKCKYNWVLDPNIIEEGDFLKLQKEKNLTVAAKTAGFLDCIFCQKKDMEERRLNSNYDEAQTGSHWPKQNTSTETKHKLRAEGKF